MSTGFYYIDGRGKNVEIDNLERSERKDHILVVRVDSGEPVQLSIFDLEVE